MENERFELKMLQLAPKTCKYHAQSTDYFFTKVPISSPSKLLILSWNVPRDWKMSGLNSNMLQMLLEWQFPPPKCWREQGDWTEQEKKIKTHNSRPFKNRQALVDM